MYEQGPEQPERCHKWFRNKRPLTQNDPIRQTEVNQTPIIKQDRFGSISCEMLHDRGSSGELH